MHIRIQIVIDAGDGEPDVLEVANVQRGPLQPGSLGLLLAEGRAGNYRLYSATCLIYNAYQ